MDASNPNDSSFATDGTDSASPPHNIEAEQAFLGALLFDNEIFHQVSDWLLPEHFYDPFHGRLYAKARELIGAGALADAVVLKNRLADDEGLSALGGPVYLVDLMREAPDSVSAPEYARLIYELALRRELITIGDNIAAGARDTAEQGSAAELIEGAEQALASVAIRGKRHGARSLDMAGVLAGAAADMDAAIKGEFLTPTGLTDLDRIIGGYAPGELIIPAGRPGQGKTLLGGALCAMAAKRGHASAFVAIEMRAERMGARWLAAESGVSYSRMRQGLIDTNEARAIGDARERIASWPIVTIDMPGASVPRLTAYLRRIKRDMDRAGTPLRFVVIDYLQKLKAHTNRGASKVAEVADISNALKDLARELNIAVVCPCQLNREVEGRDGDKKLPRLADLKWSGEIEQDADMVIGIHREAYYAEREPESKDPVTEQDRLHRAGMKTMDLIVLKNREGEAGRTVKVFCDPATGRIANLEQSRMEL